ncbi:Retrovirus-related Pol polyprotein from transposon 17.6 [Trichinella pseudospiralis]|uniref:Retrovirus-related Pol polyprotein from transposon 17.6 n=1 Tax=Trichinella pseudospiralis TaxID=6337 RepID=A0A0V1H2L8_TRIPS|nr:Retrovirus-related Pol polyprotein from transposon 17.6 [Trichinella pseudospiralis]
MIVARSLSHPCLLGADFLRPRRALIDLGDNRIKLGEVWLKLESSKTLEDRNRGEAQQECGICLLETVTLPAQSELILVDNHSIIAACSLSCAVAGAVPVRLLNGTDRPITLFKGTKRVIATDDYDTGHICKHSINTGDTPPIKQNPRRIPYHQKETVQRLLNEMSNHRVIEPSCGPWSSPIVLVKKKDGLYHFCVDYRKLNHHTKKDAHPIPEIEETLQRLGQLSGATWFSTLDLASGYWQVEVAEEDKEKTAFTTPFGLYQFRVMRFGLCNAPATFQRLMETVLCGLHWTTCMVYLDDVIVFSKDAAEHLEKLDEVFSRLQGAGLKIKSTKCKLFQERVKYLNHIVSRDGVQPDPEKIKAVEQWPTARCAKELQQFLGLASYYRRFVKGFPQLAEPLHRFSEKGKWWNWTDQSHPNFKIPFVVDTDASGDGLGAVLSQIIAGQERVVAFASCTLSKPERKYCATRREMLALVWALKQFRCFLYGRRLTVRTDHGSLTWLRNFKEPEGQVARWLSNWRNSTLKLFIVPAENITTLTRFPGKHVSNVAKTPPQLAQLSAA